MASTHTLKQLRKLHARKSERGQGMTEYIIIVALVAVAAIGAYSFFGQTVRGQMAGISDVLSGGDGTAGIASAQASATNAQTEADSGYNLGTYNTGHNNIQ